MVGRFLWLALLALPSVALADVPPLVPHATTSIRLATTDEAHAWIAFPVNESHGVPMEAYAQIMPGTPFDPARGWPEVYAFPITSALGDRLAGAPLAFREAETAFGERALPGFFAASSAPHATPIAPPDDAAMRAAHVTSLIDTYAPSVEGSTLTLRLVETTYTFDDARTASIPSTDGTRPLPTTGIPSGTCGCRVGARSPRGTFALVLLALALVRRRH